MPDPADPLEPQSVAGSSSATPPPAPEVNASTLDLPSNIAAALACIPLIGGIIFYIMEKRDPFVRFYAMQSIILGAAFLFFCIVYGIASAILTPIPVIGYIFSGILWTIWLIVGVAFLVLWLVATVKAFNGGRWEMPYIGPVARKQVEGTAAI